MTKRLIDRTTRPLSNVDAAWLRMDHPTNLMVVAGLLLFDGPIDFECLRETIDSRLLRFRRFRQLVDGSWGLWQRPRWVPDKRFSLASHLHRIALPDPGDREMLQEVVGDLTSTPLDFSKPLWQIHLIERYGEGSAVLIRIHHCIADGMALLRVLLSLTDSDPLQSPPRTIGAPNGESTLLELAWEPFEKALVLVREVIDSTWRALGNPEEALKLAGRGVDCFAAARKLLLRAEDPPTPLKGSLGVPKLAAWSRSIPLDEIRDLAKALGGTVNDTLLALLTGALRRYLLERGEEVDGLSFRAAIPVNLRSADEVRALGNRFGLVFLSLPVGVADPNDRFRELKRRMDELKGSSEAVVSFGILGALGRTPAELQELLVDFIGKKTTLVFSNVRGPEERVYLAGSPIRSLMFWVPQSGKVGLGCSIISYAGEVRLGVTSDRDLVPNPGRLSEAFVHELAAMSELAMAAIAT